MSSKNNEGKIVIMLIVLLIAFGLGSGIGISVGMSNDDLDSFNSPEIDSTVNVTNNISKYNPNFDMDFSIIEEEYPIESLNDSSSEESSGIYYSEEEFYNDSNNNLTIT
ncbi:MAG: hypothetical protein FWE58_03300 [Methanobrevibacter sp.]|nr:hypothetical protein [Methanobrevibacter sp.]